MSAASLTAGAAAILIFTACILAVKEIPRGRRRKRKRMLIMVLIIALISLIAVFLLRFFVAFMSRPQEDARNQPPDVVSTVRIVDNRNLKLTAPLINIRFGERERVLNQFQAWFRVVHNNDFYNIETKENVGIIQHAQPAEAAA